MYSVKTPKNILINLIRLVMKILIKNIEKVLVNY
jgi:hypothetical protein